MWPGRTDPSWSLLREIVLYIDRSQLVDDGAAIGAAIRVHFSRRSTLLQRTLRCLLQRGFISLIVGLSFLTPRELAAAHLREKQICGGGGFDE